MLRLSVNKRVQLHDDTKQPGRQTRTSARHRPRCPQHGPQPLLPSPLARLLHYLKLSLVFICRADDVATSSTFPSPAVYIREPIWLYKTRQQEGGGPEPERGETWKPFYTAAHCAPDERALCGGMWRIFSVEYLVSAQFWLSNMLFSVGSGAKLVVRWVKVVVWGGYFCFLVLEWWTMMKHRMSGDDHYCSKYFNFQINRFYKLNTVDSCKVLCVRLHFGSYVKEN